MGNGNGKAIVVARSSRFAGLAPLQEAEPQAASVPVLQLLVQKLQDLDRRVEALAAGQETAIQVSQPARDLPLQSSPRKIERARLRDMFD